MNKLFHLLLFFSSIIFLIVILLLDFNIGCIFDRIFNFECGTCGLTRGFKEIFKLNFIEATKYNAFSIPVFIAVVAYYIISIFDMITNKKYIFKFYNLVYKYRYLILGLYFISLIINNI